jgi:AI-2 transport protein TqsA
VDFEQRERRIQTVCLLILSAAVIAFAMWWLRSVMIPFVLATFFAFGLSPLITFQMRYLRIPRLLAALATLIVGCVVLGLLASLISTSDSQLA